MRGSLVVVGITLLAFGLIIGLTTQTGQYYQASTLGLTYFGYGAALIGLIALILGLIQQAPIRSR